MKQCKKTLFFLLIVLFYQHCFALQSPERTLPLSITSPKLRYKSLGRILKVVAHPTIPNYFAVLYYDLEQKDCLKLSKKSLV